MTDQGWIKLHRKIVDNPLFSNANMFKLWCLCLIKATHKEREQLIGNQIIKLQPGEFITGRNAISDDFNKGVKPEQRVSARTLWRWLKQFETWQMLSIRSTTKYSIISIKNWHEYQEIDQQMSNNCPATDQQVSTNKNDKNDKKEINKDIYIKYIVEIVDYLNEKAGTSYRHTTKKTQRLIRARLKEGFTVEDFKTVIDKKVAEWLHDPKMSQYLRPETLFGTKFESYLNQKVVRKGARYHASSFRSADADHWEYDGLSL